MARKHSDTVDAAIKALALDSKRNLNATQIWRLLSAGEAGLDKPIQMPKRTVQHKVASFRREFSYDVDPLQDADEVDVANSIIRDYLRMGLLEAKRYKERQKAGKLGTKDTQHMRENAKLISECERHFKRQRGTASPTKTAAGLERGRSLEPASTLQRLASSSGQTGSPGDNVSQPAHGERGNGQGAGKLRIEEEGEQDSVSCGLVLGPTVHA